MITGETPMGVLGRVAIGRPRLVVAVWVILAAVCVPLALSLSGALKSGGFENPRGEEAAGQRALQRGFGEPAQSLQVVLYRADGDVSGAVDAAGAAVRGVPHVVSVGDFRADASWLSGDRHTTFLMVGFDADDSTVQGLTDQVRDRVRGALPGVEVHVTGAPALDRDLNVQSQRDAGLAEMIAFPLLLIVLFVVFRSVVAMLVPLVLAGFALVIASAVGKVLTRFTDLSILYSNAVSIIGLAVAVDYSLFIVKRYRDELAGGADYVSALRTAMDTAGRAVRFSGLAVVVALLALFIPRMMVFSSIAFAGIVVTLVAMAMSMTLLPAVLRLLGRRINWGTPRSRARRNPRATKGILAWVHRRPVPLLLILVALFGLLALPMGAIRLQSPVASATILPPDADSRQGIERLQAGLDFRNLFPVQVILTAAPGTDGPRLLQRVRAVVDTAGSRPQTHAVHAVTNLGLPGEVVDAAVSGSAPNLPPAFGQLWARDQGRLVARVIVIPAEGPDSDATHDLVRALRDRLPRVAGPGIDVQVAGATAHGVDFDEALVASLPAILGAVALITLGLLARAFRSWRLPLLAFALNAMVVAASVGLLTMISQGALGQRIDPTTPVLLFAIMFGLSMDYMVIMIARMRERYLESRDHRDAVLEGMRRTAGLVNGAALIMVAVFLSFLVAKISVVQQLGLGLAIAVILDAVVVRLLVMPAALNLLGARVWGRVPPAAPAPEPALPRSAHHASQEPAPHR
jgi:RND superfamily putative drug exporter